jgi:hypothetical protein
MMKLPMQINRKELRVFDQIFRSKFHQNNVVFE